MKWIALIATASLTASCARPIEFGDFCDLAEDLRTSDPELAAAIVDTDPPFARGLNRHNRMVGECPE